MQVRDEDYRTNSYRVRLHEYTAAVVRTMVV